MTWLVEASAREVWEAYHEALVRQDWPSARFWRPILIERLELLSERTGNSGRPGTPNREYPKG